MFWQIKLETEWTFISINYWKGNGGNVLGKKSMEINELGYYTKMEGNGRYCADATCFAFWF